MWICGSVYITRKGVNCHINLFTVPKRHWARFRDGNQEQHIRTKTWLLYDGKLQKSLSCHLTIFLRKSPSKSAWRWSDGHKRVGLQYQYVCWRMLRTISHSINHILIMDGNMSDFFEILIVSHSFNTKCHESDTFTTYSFFFSLFVHQNLSSAYLSESHSTVWGI